MSDIVHNEPTPTPAEIWHLLKETEQLIGKQALEAERRFQESERVLEAQRLETERLKQETENLKQETEQQLKVQKLETERVKRETERKIQQANEAIGNLGNRLGEFVEGLVAPAAIRLFQEWGIEVEGLNRDMERNNRGLNLATQVDLLAVNGDCCVVIEVKSHLSVDDVNEHLERMKKFKPLFPEYADKTIYAAVAAVVLPEDVAKYAYRKGFFVIGQQGNTAVILNDKRFKPMTW